MLLRKFCLKDFSVLILSSTEIISLRVTPALKHYGDLGMDSEGKVQCLWTLFFHLKEYNSSSITYSLNNIYRNLQCTRFGVKTVTIWLSHWRVGKILHEELQEECSLSTIPVLSFYLSTYTFLLFFYVPLFINKY